jgi:hypothetical protein
MDRLHRAFEFGEMWGRMRAETATEEEVAAQLARIRASRKRRWDLGREFGWRYADGVEVKFNCKSDAEIQALADGYEAGVKAEMPRIRAERLRDISDEIEELKEEARRLGGDAGIA